MTGHLGWVFATLMVIAGACSDPEVEPLIDACKTKCSEQEACCPLGGCAGGGCVAECEGQYRNDRKLCPAQVDKYVSCLRSAPTWSCELDPSHPQGIDARPDGCDLFPLTCCLNQKSATPQVIPGCPAL